ncbi:MAG: hypothetical protein PHY29_08555 [Syntrophales bacterium]|nr:hypothetical protein [Syntrophales bacterium]
MSEFQLEDEHDLRRLEMAAQCIDNLREAEARVSEDGMFTVNRYGSMVEHPGVKIIKDMRLLFVKIIRELNLDVTVPESRPPRRY